MWRLRNRWLARRRKGELDLLRSCYEDIESRYAIAESNQSDAVEQLTLHSVSIERLVASRSWSVRRVLHLINSAIAKGSLRRDSNAEYRLTPAGARLSIQATRNHRLWELYLIHFADIAPSRVDREADQIEHILEPELVEQLEQLLLQKRSTVLLKNPHQQSL
jgi:manganese/zinc/iron transport system permease protein